MLSKQDKLIAAIGDFFAKAGLEQVDVPILQPAEPFLDCVGEDLRRRIFMTENEHGEALCLRPEFTIPVSLAHIKAKETLPHHYAYLGEVFRQRRQEKHSFYQAGIEHLGEADEAGADATSLAQALALLRTLLPAHSFKIITGDHGLFEAVLSALQLKPSWQRRLRGCFGELPRLCAILADLAKPSPALDLPSDIAQAIESGNEPILIELLEAQMYSQGLPLHFSRSASEIAQRLIEKQNLTRQPLTNKKRQALEDFLSLHLPLTQAPKAVCVFAQENGLDLGMALAKFERRIEALQAHNLALESINYDAAFGRSLDYYTGFIYEVRLDTPSALRDEVLVGGGRYDHLLHLLGASTPIPAVGFSLWLDRLEALLN